MTTKKPSAVQGLRRGVGANQAEPAPQPETANRAHVGDLPPRPEKPVRFTLDLDQERHTFLKAFALECGAGVGGAQVMRALLDELREGANLPVQVRARIWADKR